LASEQVATRRSSWTIPRWTRGWLALLLAAGALALLALGLASTGTPIVVEINGHAHPVRTRAATVEEALRRAGVQLFPEDQVTPGLQSQLEAQTVIEIKRAWPVAIHADGHTWQIRTHATTIGRALDEAGVALHRADEVWLDGEMAQPTTQLFGESSNVRRVTDRSGFRDNKSATQSPDEPQIVVRRATSVTVDDGGTPFELHTTATTLGQALEEHGLTLFLGDKVTPGLQERLVSDMVVTILRSTPVQIRVDGHTIRTRTRAGTVAGVLGQEGIALVGTDYVTPAMDAPIQPDMTIQVTRVREEYIVEFESIPFKTVWVPDPEVEIDNIRLAQAGQLGINKRRYRVVYENDQEVARFLEDSWAAQPPITKTMAYGTKIVIRTLDTPEGPVEYWRKMRAYLVSYKPASSGKPKDHPRYGYTRLGWKLKKGIVAVDPDVIPLKTNLYVPGYGLARAGDTGGGVKGKLVDLGYGDNDYQSWHWWGDIYLLTPVPPRSKIMWVLPDYPNFPDRRR
jgi:uncharacterized protein YabE (DUF348 family)/3D (Asp-Asp-Asp) domain-containing protein